MKRLLLSLLALLPVLGWGCGAELTQQGGAVHVADENIVRPCRYLGDVIGRSVDIDAARNAARNQAASMGATHVVFVSQTGIRPADTMARAYSCPDQWAKPTAN